MEKKFIVNLKGKDFVLYAGLLDEAHKKGLVAINTEILQYPSKENENTCIVKASVVLKDGKHFEGIGDANPKNVNKLIALHLIRMAETRAKARALRDAVNVDMVSFEELADIDEVIGAKQETKQRKAIQKQEQKNNNLATTAQLKKMFVLSKQVGYETEDLKNYLLKEYGVTSSKELTKEQISKVLEDFEIAIKSVKGE